MNKMDFFNTFDQPYPYKGLLLHPVKLEQIYEFYFLSSCLVLEKNSSRNIAHITMSYLGYMYEMSDETNNYILLFDSLMRLVLKKKDIKTDYGYDSDKNPYFSIDGVRYNSKDFNEIKLIISSQNDLELPDERIQKEVRDKIEEARRYKAGMNGGKTCSLEEQILSLSIYTGWTPDYIKNMTIRKFTKAIRRADHILSSTIYLEASLSGMVEFKDKSVIKHWLAEIGSGKNDDVTVDLSSVQDKVNFSDAM